MTGGKLCGRCAECQPLDEASGICACHECRKYGKKVRLDSTYAVDCSCFEWRTVDAHVD